MDRPPFRFAVQATNACRRAASGAIPFAKSKISAIQRFSLPITTWARDPRSEPRARLARTWPRSRRWRQRPPAAKRCASVAECSASTITCRRYWPRKRRRSICSPTAVWSWVSAPAGAKSSTPRWDSNFDRPGRRIAKLAEVVSLIKAHWRGRRTGLLGRLRSGARVRGTAAAGATAAPADHDRRRRTAHALLRRPRSRHRQHVQCPVRGTRCRRPRSHRRSPSVGSASSAAAAGARYRSTRRREFAVLHRDHRRSRGRAGRHRGDDGHLGRPAAQPSQRSDRLAGNALWNCCVRAATALASITSRCSSRRSNPSRRWWPCCTAAEP